MNAAAIEVRPWRPADGAAAGAFRRAWCARCAHLGTIGLSCPLMGLAARHRLGDPAYPPEFVVGLEGEPCCTRFLEVGHVDAGGAIPDLRQGSFA